MHTYQKTVTGWTKACLALALLCVVPWRAAGAETLSQKDVQIIAKAIGFMEPAPSGAGTVAVVYSAADAASKQAADTIVGYFGDGLQAGAATLKAKSITAADLSGSKYLAIITLDAASAGQVSAAAQAQHALCITTDEAAVQAGTCVMAVKTTPNVEITVSKAAATAAGVGFGSAFLLMAHQI